MTKRVLLDMDPGCDDTVALLMALGSDEVDVAGVTTVAGNTTVENGTENALSVLTHVDRSDVPVASGCDRTLAGETVTAEHVHGPGGLPESVRARLPDPAAEPVDRHAVEFILDSAREHGEDLTLCFLGPTTNLATALALEPDLGEIVGEIYVLAGAIFRTGNVTPAASFNAYVDPTALRRALTAAPRLVPLDVSEPAILPLEVLDAFDEEGGLLGTVSTLLREYTLEQVRRKWDRDGVIASDSVVIADVVGGVLDYEEGYVTVDASDGVSRGATIYDEHGKHDDPPNATVGLDVDVDAYRDVVDRTLRSVRTTMD